MPNGRFDTGNGDPFGTGNGYWIIVVDTSMFCDEGGVYAYVQAEEDKGRN